MSEKLNGSVHRLAEAFGDVIMEAMSAVEERLNTRIDETNARIIMTEERLDTRIDEAEERLSVRIDRGVENIVAEKRS